MKQYDHKKIEKKWQKIWEEKKIFETNINFKKPKFYPLIEFPYPSGKGLHVGHPRPYTALDIIARKKRLQGYNVLYPIGWDSFGLPTENYAIKNKTHPKIITDKNIKNFKRQLKSIGFSFDWSKEINTSEPKYYKWTQWIFIQMFKKGLAYKKEFPINWCPNCKIGLANEEVINGNCERCGNLVVKKIKNQWMLKITNYADRLLNDLKLVNYSKRIKTQQENWIGRSYGIEIDFKIFNSDEKLKIFTTRPDTIYGVTYMVISPENFIIEKLKNKILNLKEIYNYKKEIKENFNIEKINSEKEKDGLLIKGIKAINPLNKERLPIFISNYVLNDYGTGAIMAVPAHDYRDFYFAKKFNLPIKKVIYSNNNKNTNNYEENIEKISNEGKLINSGILNDLPIKKAIEKIIFILEKKKIGKKAKKYKLRDWVFSRQRYWGEPIPLVYCEKCGWVSVKEKDLPIKLPKIDSYEPTKNGESPLSSISSWVITKCPICNKNAKRETDTMPQWAGSSWYFLRYIDNENIKNLASKEKINYWIPVDWYNGGMEHTTLHLLYSRFWYKFLYDIKIVNTKEPYLKRTSHGIILGSNNEKMSKSRSNIVNPDDIINEFGADTLRLYEMFIGDFEKNVPWSDNGVKGCYRFLNKVWKLSDIVVKGKEYRKKLEIKINKTIKKVTEDYESLKFNTAISSLMELANEFIKTNKITLKEMKTLIILLNPIAPHITEELWEMLNYKGMLNESLWPNFEKSKIFDEKIYLPIQINGKLKGIININRNSTIDEIKNEILEKKNIYKNIKNKKIIKEIFIPNKIFNIIVK